MSQRKVKKNVDDLLHKAESGDPQALYELGCYYFYLPKGECDYNKADKYWRMAAEIGDSCSMYALGRLFDGGIGIPKTYKKASELAKKGPTDYPYGSWMGLDTTPGESIKWFKAAAELGHIGAMICFGKYYKDHPKLASVEDWNQAGLWLYEAAESKNRIALFEVSEDLMYGNFGVRPEPEIAFEMLKASAEKGYDKAQLALGQVLSKQAEEKLVDAVQWYHKANENNDRFAIFELAESYFFGKGVEIDYSKAIEYYKSEYAMQDHYSFTDSAYKIGYCYYHGLGVRRDLHRAKEWILIAVDERNSEDAQKLLQEIETELTSKTDTNTKGNSGDLPF